MKYTKRESLGQWLKKGEDFKDSDMVEIANEGKQTEGQFGTQDVFLLKLRNGNEGNTNFNQTTINNLIDAFGEDSINWIGKKVKVMMIKQNVQGKIMSVYYFLHPDTILDDESGQFIIPGKKSKEDNIPVIEAEEEDPNAQAQIAAEQEKAKK